MKEAMKKITQVTLASLKISMLVLLFFVTAAPSIIENSRSSILHQENLKGENSVASGNLDHFAVPNTNKLGQAHHTQDKPGVMGDIEIVVKNSVTQRALDDALQSQSITGSGREHNLRDEISDELQYPKPGAPYIRVFPVKAICTI